MILKNQGCCEYLVYEYAIQANNQDGQFVKSNLDPITYRAYHGGMGDSKLTLLRVYKCPGHTGNFSQYCELTTEILSNKK